MEIRDKDGMIIFNVERSPGGVALVADVYGSKNRVWLTPAKARELGQRLIEAAEQTPET